MFKIWVRQLEGALTVQKGNLNITKIKSHELKHSARVCVFSALVEL